LAKELQTTRTRGGNYHPIPMKDFVISHLARLGEDYPANMHRAYKEQLKILAEQKGRKKPYHQCAYSSFIVSFNNLVREGLVVFSGREEESDDKKVQNFKTKVMRKYFRLAGPGSNGHQVNGIGKLVSETSNGHKPVPESSEVFKLSRQLSNHHRSNGLKSP
jgi:hypothetical protein